MTIYTHQDYLKDRREALDRLGGDVNKYTAEHQQVVGKAIKWADIETYAAVYPEHAHYAQDEILRLLGYLPHPNIIIPHEVFIRTLIAQKAAGQIAAPAYEQELIIHVKHIRNDDMRKFGWANKLRYTWAEIEAYNNYLPEFADAVQERIKRYFGELPPLDYIIPADMMLRKEMGTHNRIDSEQSTGIDYKAFCIIDFRKSVMQKGFSYAENTALLVKKDCL